MCSDPILILWLDGGLWSRAMEKQIDSNLARVGVNANKSSDRILGFPCRDQMELESGIKTDGFFEACGLM